MNDLFVPISYTDCILGWTFKNSREPPLANCSFLKNKTKTTKKRINWKNKSKSHLKRKRMCLVQQYTNGTKPYQDSPERCCTLNEMQVFFHLKNNINQACVSKIPNHILTTVLCSITCIISQFFHRHLKWPTCSSDKRNNFQPTCRNILVYRLLC